jgi:hypothetical protein
VKKKKNRSDWLSNPYVKGTKTYLPLDADPENFVFLETPIQFDNVIFVYIDTKTLFFV